MVSSRDYNSIAGFKPVEIYGVQDPSIAEAFFYITRAGVRDGLAFNFARLFAQSGVLWVDTATGDDGNNGASPETAFATMAAAFAAVADNGTIYVSGDVREQITAPLGVTGVKIIGISGGRPRHDDGIRWREEAVAGDAPLVTIREQGWEFHNILFVPQTGHSAIRAHRAETASFPDSSHFIVRGCKFIGNGAIGAGVGIGIEDWGGNHHYLVEGCEFNDLEFAIVAPAGSPGIAAPLRDIIRDNVFHGNKNDICMDGSHCLILGNHFMTAYDVTDHPNTVNMAYLSDVSGANRICDNTFADVDSDVAISKGYVSSTGDVWRNRVKNVAADIVTVPGA